MPFFNVHFFEVFLKNFLKKLLTTISWSIFLSSVKSIVILMTYIDLYNLLTQVFYLYPPLLFSLFFVF